MTANCDAVLPWMAAAIGFVGGLVVIFLGELLERFKLDDAVGAIPVHLGAGFWGTLDVAFFVRAPDCLNLLSFLGIRLGHYRCRRICVSPGPAVLFISESSFLGSPAG